MTKILKCDLSADAAYVAQSLPPSSVYTITFEMMIPAATFAAVVPTPGAFAELLTLGGVGGLYGHPSPPTYSTDDGGGFASTPPNTADHWAAVTVTLTYTSGTDRDVLWNVDGTDLFAAYPVTYPADDTQPFDIRLGGFGVPSTDQIYFFRNVVVKDGSSAVIFSDDFSSDDTSAWDTTYGAATVEDAPVVATGALTIKIYDLSTNELADISAIALERSYEPAHNSGRTFTIQAPAAHALLTDVADDDFPNLWEFNRKIIVWEDYNPTQPLIHGRIDTIEWNGDGDENLVTITVLSPMLTDLGYDADDRAGRPVRDETGNFINPTFTGTGSDPTKVSGPDLVQQILTNSVNPDPTMGEGQLPIVLGTFDVDVPPAIDLNPGDSMTWPALAGDFFQQLCQSGVVDIIERPVDPTEDLDPYVMVEISAVSSAGTDKSDTVHFHYWTDDFNASACRRVAAGKTINNKPFFYLGPRIDTEHWRANIAPDSPGVTPDPTASRALYGGPGDNPGQFMSIEVFDSLGDESSSRPLYLALYNAELGYRLAPRYLLYVTPNPAAKALFDAPKDFDISDEVGIKTGAPFGIVLDEKERVMGYTATWSREGVKQLSELLTTADVTL